MSLICPGDIGGRDQCDSQPLMPWRLHKLVDCPVSENKAKYKHQNSKSVVDDLRRDLIRPNACPDPVEDHHWEAIDRP